MKIKVGKVNAGRVTVDGQDVDPKDAARIINERFSGKDKAAKGRGKK